MWKNKFLTIILLSLLGVNTVILMQISGIVIFPVRNDRVEQMRKMSLIFASYIEKIAADLGVDGYPSVRGSLASYVYDVQKATTVQSISAAIFKHIQKLKDTIVKEAEHRQKQSILSLINRCINETRKRIAPSIIEISKDKSGKFIIKDPENILSKKYNKALKKKLRTFTLWQNIRIKVSGSGADFVMKTSLEERYKALSRKLKDIMEELVMVKQRYGLLPLSGEGVVVKMYDASSMDTEEAIIHDSDVRDLVNELWAAGAIGVEVGGERLITSSSIRCIGPTILVNNRPIVVNPITIKAVGNPKVLKSALLLIKNHLKLFNINVEIKAKKHIELSKYRH